ncbi:hypothetical protein YC2023_123904 [Brassica napus]
MMKYVIFLCVNRIVCLIWSIDSHVTRSVSILGLSSGPLDLTEKNKWGNKKLYIHTRKDRRRLSGRNSHEKHQDLPGIRYYRLHTGKVDNSETSHEWCYISCSKSSWKLRRGLSSFVCGSYHDEKAVGIVR